MKINMTVGVVSKGRSTDTATVVEGASSTNSSDGKLRSFVRRLIKKEPCTCKSVVLESKEALEERGISTRKEPCTCMPAVPESKEALEEPVVDVFEDRPSRLLRIGRVSEQIVRYLSIILGVIGGIYAILRLCGCEFVRDDSFEIFVRRK